MNQLDKACFAHDLAKRTISHKISKDWAYKITRNPKYDGYQRGLASMVYKFFDKRPNLRVSVNEDLAKELHKPVVKKFKLKKVYARFKHNIWAAGLAEMGSLSSFNCGNNYLLCIIDVFTKCAWVKPYKDKNCKTILHGFIEIVNESKCLPNKLWVNQGREFYTSPMVKWLEDNFILMS